MNYCKFLPCSKNCRWNRVKMVKNVPKMAEIILGTSHMIDNKIFNIFRFFNFFLWILFRPCFLEFFLKILTKYRGPTGCLYKLSQINLVWGPLKCTKSNFNPVYVFPHFKSFCLVVLQLILSLKLSEIEQFEKQAENCLFANKIEFFGKWLHPRAKLKKTDPT